ncbi:MAG: amidohydrolase family protein, partial [Candidatus Omnitrophota bacterium]
HYFSLTDSCCETYDTRTKMNPPLRSKADMEAVKKALADGTIDAIASDHAPHGKHEKETVFEDAAFGIIGLETSLALSISLVLEGAISWGRLVELMSVNPAGILGLAGKGRLSAGSDADITIIDRDKEWTYTKDLIRSKSKNSPFIDRQFKGKAVATITGGRFVFKDEGLS